MKSIFLFLKNYASKNLRPCYLGLIAPLERCIKIKLFNKNQIKIGTKKYQSKKVLTYLKICFKAMF